jgi:protein-serine/threonine kinase
VYVAKTHATDKKVVIKEIDLAHQTTRKNLVVNEILAMKESQHPNIITFLDSYLVNDTEVCIVMEYMERGVFLTEIIDNNTFEEQQISRICFEVRDSLRSLVELH